jgi:hypothetical protein
VAKIALLCRTFSESTQNLASALHHQKQDVVVITRKFTDTEESFPFPVLHYFEKWTMTEAIRFLPTFLKYDFDLVHFVFDEPKIKITLAHLFLSAIQEAIPSRASIASFFCPINKSNQFKLVIFLNQVQAVTVSTRQQLLLLNRLGRWIKKIDSTVIPPIKNYSLSISDASTEPLVEIKKLIANANPYLILPEDPNESIKSFLKSSLKNYSFIVLGSRPFKSQKGFYYMGNNLSAAEETELFLRAQSCWLAGFDLSLSELVKYRQLSVVSISPLIVDSSQQSLLHGLVADRKTGWVISTDLSDLEQAVANIPSMKSEIKNLPKSQSLDLFDSSINELNRLYQKSLSVEALRN